MTKKLISLPEFLTLPEELQFELLHKHGVYIGKQKIGNQTIVLFQLNSFYVEVYYKKYRKIIDRIITTDSTDILVPYLGQINVRDLPQKDNK